MSYKLVIFVFLIGTSFGLQVAPASPCSSLCIDASSEDPSQASSSNTGSSDVSCRNSDYTSTDAGKKFKGCMSCLETSSYTSGGESDQGWFLYNLRYTVDWCLFGTSSTAKSKCVTSASCGPLQKTFDQSLDPRGATFDYCTADGGVFSGGAAVPCTQCLESDPSETYLANFVIALSAGCQQKPGAGTVIGLNQTVFSSTLVAITSPSLTATSNTKSGLSMGAKIGIIVGAVVVFLTAVGSLIFCFMRRRSRNALNSGCDPRFGAANITAPHDNAYSSPLYFPGSDAKAPILSKKSFVTQRSNYDPEKSSITDLKLSRPSSNETQFSDAMSTHSAQLSPNPPPSTRSKGQKSPNALLAYSQISARVPSSMSQRSPNSILSRSPPPAHLKRSFTPVPVHTAYIPAHSPAYTFNGTSPQNSPPIAPSRSMSATGMRRAPTPLGSHTLSSRDNGPKSGGSAKSYSTSKYGSPATSPKYVPKSQPTSPHRWTKSGPNSPQHPQIMQISPPQPQTNTRAETAYTAMDMDTQITTKAEPVPSLENQMQAQAEAMANAQEPPPRSESRLGMRLLTRMPSVLTKSSAGKEAKIWSPDSPETDVEQWPGTL